MIEVEIKQLKSLDWIVFPEDGLDFFVHKGYATPEIVAMYMELVVENRNRWLW